jgi:general secretion pathway protein F
MSSNLRLDELIALNDEIVALVRGGVPLGRGLLGFGDDVAGRLGKVSRALGQELERGASLSTALERVGPSLPQTYRAVVEAGLRAGRLPSALEDLADYARGFADLRRAAGQALIYPMLVLMFGYGLFLAFLIVLVPRIADAFETLGVRSSPYVRLFEQAGATAHLWGPILPAAVGLGVGMWLWVGRARGLDATRALRWVPWMTSIMRDWRTANFAGWLGMMSQHGVPLPEALELAGQSAGDRPLAKWAHQSAAQVRSGVDTELAFAQQPGVPPLLVWLMALGAHQGTLTQVLLHADELYRRRAQMRAERLRVFLPTVLLVAIGGCSALLYVLTVYLPWSQLLNSIAGTTS